MSGSAFDKLRKRMAEGQTRAHLLGYHKDRTKPNLIGLIEHVALPEAKPILTRLRSCTWKHPCCTATCPTCGEKLKARARDDALNRVVERLGRFPKDVEVSYVTIDGPRTPLTVDAVRPAFFGFKRQL